MGGKSEFVTYLKGVYYDALFLTLWNLRNFKFVRNIATVDVLGCDNNHSLIPLCCVYHSTEVPGLLHISVGSALLIFTGWQVRRPGVWDE